MALFSQATDLQTRQTVWVSRNVAKGRPQLNSHREDIIGRGMESDGLPAAELANHLRLSKDEKDKYGIPKLILSVEWKENDNKMTRDFVEQQTEMYERMGFKNIKVEDTGAPPGSDIHEMGGVRMGRDPKTSQLNEFNQLHACKNVFVSDGACMTSGSTQNPTLTFMTLTARAANHAVEELTKGNL